MEGKAEFYIFSIELNCKRNIGYGDAIGPTLALKTALENLGKTVTYVSCDGVPQSSQFVARADQMALAIAVRRSMCAPGKASHVDFYLPPSQGRDKFDAIRAAHGAI